MRAKYCRPLTGWEQLEPRMMLAADVGPVAQDTLLDIATASTAAPHLTGVQPSALSTSEASSPPNIVVFMTDDLDENSLQVMLDAGLMPNLQTYIVDQGVNFTESFVTDSKCCPSRATFLTGQYPHNHGVLTNFPPTGGAGGLDDDSTIATWLQSVGYQTAFVGKYLNAYGMVAESPLGQALNPFYIPPGWEQWYATVGETTYSVYDYEVNQNGELVSYGSSPADYQTDVLANLSAQVIYDLEDSHSEDPLFLNVNPVAPHHEESNEPTDEYSDLWRWTIRPAPRHDWRDSAPLSDGLSLTIPVPRGPAFNELDLSDKPSSVQDQPLLTGLDVAFLTRQYLDRLASLRAVDDMVGTVVDALQDTGRLDNTVLIFTSDNGYLYGEHRLSQKVYPYEPSIRVPLYISTPWQNGPALFDGVVLNNDLAPTITQLAGATPDIVVDGYSWAGLLETGSDTFARSRFLIEHWAHDQAGGVVKIPSFSAVRSFVGVDRLYVEYRSGGDFSNPVIDIEFYNLDADPNQLQSIHNEPATAVQIAQQKQWINLMRNASGATVRALETFVGSTAPVEMGVAGAESSASLVGTSNSTVLTFEEIVSELADTDLVSQVTFSAGFGLKSRRNSSPMDASALLGKDASRWAEYMASQVVPAKNRAYSPALTAQSPSVPRFEMVRDRAFEEFETTIGAFLREFRGGFTFMKQSSRSIG